MSIFDNYCLTGCSPTLIVSLNLAINDISNVEIIGDNNIAYCKDNVQYSYSLDGVCWSGYGKFEEILNITLDLGQDFFLKTKVNGPVTNVTDNNDPVDYSTALDSGFLFGSNCQTNNLTYSPYSNMDTAVALQQQMVDYMACVVGIPIYYFKVTPNANSKDLTFKEYCLMNVQSVKQIKLIVTDGLMPSSKPEFSEFGIDFQTDWETYISKTHFSTAFGPTALPMEHDFIYIPMMKRMWMVNSAYEEKKDSFMWNSAYFTVALVKYQEKESIDLGDQEEFVGELVTAKYEELFGTDENLDSGEGQSEMPVYTAASLYPIFESDAVRAKASIYEIAFEEVRLNLKAVKLSDSMYNFIKENTLIVYQSKYCGDEGSCSFIIRQKIVKGDSVDFITIGNITFTLTYGKICIANCPKAHVFLKHDEYYFVYCRWSRRLNMIELCACPYTHINIPEFKLKPFHYYFDVDEPYSKSLIKYDVEMTLDSKQEVILTGFPGYLTNFKLFDAYTEVADLMQQYPNNSHLIINDTARKFVELSGGQL